MVDNSSKNGRSIRGQVTEEYREAILSGRLAPGATIPSTQELSRHYGTREANVHHALSVLVKEGLITRVPRVGTTVNAIKSEMTCVALYIRQPLTHPRFTFLQLFHRYFEAALNRQGVECLLINENRENSGVRRLKRLAETRRIQGIAMTGANRTDIEWLQRLPVPFACLTSVAIDNRVYTDRAGMLRSAFSTLKNMGCSTVGLLCSYPKADVDGHSEEWKRFYGELQDARAEYGLEMRDEWSVVPEHCIDIDRFDEFAFNGFRKIWACDERPEGLFVYAEDLLTGVMMAVLAEQVRVPQDLKLVLHKTQERSQLCPVPCVFLENSAQEMAEALFAQLVALYGGEKVQGHKVAYHPRLYEGPK